MESNQPNFSLRELQEQEMNLREILDKYLAKWYWLLIGMVITISLAFLYLRYTTPQYEVTASVLIKDDSKGGGISEISAFQDLGIFNGQGNLENEIEILKSRALMRKVVQELRLNVRYLLDDGPIDLEPYTNPPVSMSFQHGDSSVYAASAAFELVILSPLEFELTDLANDQAVQHYAFGKPINTRLGTVTITPNEFGKYTFAGQKIKIEVSPIQSAISQYQSKIMVEPVNANSNVIQISLRDAVKEKAVAIVDNLIKQHGIDAIEDKNLVSRNTADFITERMDFITRELSEVEGNVEAFKTHNKLVDVVSEAGIFLASESENEKLIIENGTQLHLADFVYNYLLEHNDNAALIPSNLGLSDPGIERSIDAYNTLVLERNRILKNSGEKNPVILNLDSQIQGIHKGLKESLANLKSALKIRSQELKRQQGVLNAEIASVPKYEREFREIQRQQQIKESLYLYLLQKREETAIALAVTVANAKIIDHAYGSDQIVSPNRRMIYLIALLLGLFIPLGIIYIRDLLDNKIHSKSDIDRLRLPYLGDIPETDLKQKLVANQGANTSISEAFRTLRTNIDFILKTANTNTRTVFITSTVAKEGKSFIALNLSSIIAISGKKVLLIGMDLRAPKLIEYLNLPDGKGLTNYVADPQLKLSDVIQKVAVVENLHVLSSGDIPPNPSELLMHERVRELFEEVKAKYDYVIVDTAPVGMVTDTLLLSQYADTFIYVTRVNYLDKRMLHLPEMLYKEKRLPNMAILLNGTNSQKGYGYGYGYGYGTTQEPVRRWWHIFRPRNSKY
jgi:tyrosine-protein kinase Etk/Wzc